MKVSIVTINYNDAEGLQRTLASVACQTYQDIEHIVVDGGSTDGSVEVIRSFPHVSVWVSERDKGIYNGMNKGIQMATGEYIVILNSADCLVNPDVIERMVASLDDETDVLLANIINVWPGKAVKRRKHTGCKPNVNIVNPSLYNFYQGTIPHDAALIRKSVYSTYGLYDEQMRICSDWKLFLHAMVLGVGNVSPLSEGHIKHVDIDMVLFDMTGTSNQNTDQWMAEKRPELERCIPPRILADYDSYAKDISLMQRIHRHPWAFILVRFIERVLFKFEKWFE